MRSSGTQQALSHRLFKYIGGVSLQSQEIHSPLLTTEPATPTLLFTRTTSST